MKKRILALLLTLALLVTCAVFTVSANNEDESSGTVVADPTWASSAPVAFDGTTMVCPHCLAKDPTTTTLAAWEEWDPDGTKAAETDSAKTSAFFAAGKHYMISNDTQLTATFYACQKECVIWIKPGVVVTAGDGKNAFRVNSSAGKLWLLGGTGAKLTGTGAPASASGTSAAGRTTTNGGLMRMTSAGEIHFGGDLTIELSDPVTTGMGGVIDVYAGTLYMHDGTINGVQNNGTPKDANGATAVSYGAVITRNTGAFVMEGGRIQGGSSTQPAPIYMENGSATIKGDAYVEAASGSITGSGGAVYVAKGNFTAEGNAFIKGGSVSAKGGAIYAVASTATATIQGSATVSGGTAAGGGGNIYVDGAKVYVKGSATVKGGSAPNGGNIYAFYNGAKGWVYLEGGTVKDGNATGVATTLSTEGFMTNGGGNVYVSRSCEVQVKTNATVENGTATAGGGNVFARGTLTISGGQLSGGTAKWGGSVYAYDQSTSSRQGKVNMTSGIIDGGTAEKGGAMAGVFSVMDLSGGTVQDGSAWLGGNIYATKSSNLFVKTGATVTNGTAINNPTAPSADADDYGKGGNILIDNYADADIQGGTVSNGKSRRQGPNVFVGGTGCVLDLESGKLTGGVNGYVDENTTTGTYHGGSVVVGVNGTFTMKGGEITGGQATGYGGAVLVSNNAEFTMTGGTIKGNNGMATTGGGSDGLRVQGGTVKIAGTAKIVSGGAGQGNCIDILSLDGAPATLILDGTPELLGSKGQYAGNIFMRVFEERTPMLLVLNTYAGNASVKFGTAPDAMGEAVSADAAQCGSYVTTTPDPVNAPDTTVTEFVAGGSFSGNLRLENMSGAPLAGKEGTLYVASAGVSAVVEDKATTTWYATLEDAYNTAKNDVTKAVVMLGDALTINAEDTVCVDFNGKAVNVNNAGTLLGMDSTATTAEAGTAVATVTGAGTVATDTVFNGKTYVALAGADKAYTFHELTLEIVSVNLRPSAERASLYYTAEIKGDATLMAAKTKAGVAVTLKEDAADNKLTDYMYTVAPAGNGDYNGALVNGIIINEAGKNTGDRAVKEIYARAYIELNGTIIMSELVDWSLLEVVNEVAAMYGDLEPAQQTAFDSLYGWCKEIVLPTAPEGKDPYEWATV